MAEASAFPKLDHDELPISIQAIWDLSYARRGEAKFIAGMGHNPELLDWYLKDFYQKVFYGGNVDRRYKELGRLRLSHIHGCRSCNLGNRLDAIEGGLCDTEVDHIHELNFEGFSEADKSVMKLADLMSLAAEPGSVLEEKLYVDLAHYFSNAEVLEMAMTFSLLSGIARFIFAFELAEKEEYCRF